MPSLGSMQAAFLANIASLFNSHGRLVCSITLIIDFVILFEVMFVVFFRPFVLAVVVKIGRLLCFHYLVFFLHFLM